MEQVNDLLGAARAATGLEHFGDDSFMDGLERCVRAFREEAHLTAAGEAAIRGQIVGLLSQRLHIEDWYRRHPEIEEEPIEAPLFGVSLPRTGSEPPNEMKAPASSALTAGLSTQLGTKANLRIDDDQALVITTTPGGARFRNAVLHDLFSLTMSYWSHTTSLNMTQMAADDDGNFTLVVAHEDPGVHNWLDTCGLNQMLFGHRWQSFPGDSPQESPRIAARLVRFRDLDAALPPGIQRIDATGRREQLERRAAGFRRRFIDH